MKIMIPCKTTYSDQDKSLSANRKKPIKKNGRKRGVTRCIYHGGG
jgi:hypothetical protein